MIQQALKFTQNCLNRQLMAQYGLTENAVVLNNVINTSGSVPAKNQNKMVLSLINLEHETNRQFNGRYTSNANGQYTNITPFVRFNMDVMMVSNFDDYDETLKFLDATVAFFQSNTSLSAQNSSDIPAGLEKLEFDVEKISYYDMHSLWSAMGAKYQPSIVYKVRLVTLQANQIEGLPPTITSTSNNINP